MINNINFNGSVFWAGNTSNRGVCKPDEKRAIAEYALDNNCDVIVLDRDYYADGSGKYTTIAVKQREITGTNEFYGKIFDFLHPEREQERKININTIV
ncbi:MAG: hypothetical protein IJ877_03665 [Candidatus Gastranaerophilales bacterium]|nr:hypothetical protein [Candidatus Gastranaerophilales bacterium]